MLWSLIQYSVVVNYTVDTVYGMAGDVMLNSLPNCKLKAHQRRIFRHSDKVFRSIRSFISMKQQCEAALEAQWVKSPAEAIRLPNFPCSLEEFAIAVSEIFDQRISDISDSSWFQSGHQIFPPRRITLFDSSQHLNALQRLDLDTCSTCILGDLLSLFLGHQATTPFKLSNSVPVCLMSSMRTYDSFMHRIFFLCEPKVMKHCFDTAVLL